MNENQINRREFLRDLGMLGAGVLAATSPWLKTFADVNETAKERVKLGMIGPGSRGQFLLGFLSQNPKADIVAFADPYQPSIDAALSIVPTAKVYHDYKKLLEDKAIEAVVVATPLATHYQIVMDAFDAGKHVYCEKTIGYTMEQCFNMYQKHLETGLLFFTGQQRLFDPRYIKAMEMVHQGIFGEITAVHAFWNRNGDWRRDVPQKDLERYINWRLYKDSSKGLMTELACHQLQVGTWALGRLPQKVMGHGAITYWKDGREVYDNINTIYVFEDGKKLTWGSDIANKFYGLEEQILGSKGTVEPERGRYYFEDTDLAPAPAFLQMLNDWDAKLFGAKAFAGTSWAAETGSTNRGELILGKEPDNDGTSLLTEAFVEACITGKQPDRIAEEGYYASLLCLWGHEALEREEIINFPTEYQIDYDVYGTKKQSPNI
ncbi:MAG: Gfo/Idh/MocA family oxidoreductase [Prevotella sp.]|nr:Gfo/Idh/MocA family oxidoreductase [Prevotella sp.]